MRLPTFESFRQLPGTFPTVLNCAYHFHFLAKSKTFSCAVIFLFAGSSGFGCFLFGSFSFLLRLCTGRLGTVCAITNRNACFPTSSFFACVGQNNSLTYCTQASCSSNKRNSLDSNNLNKETFLFERNCDVQITFGI